MLPSVEALIAELMVYGGDTYSEAARHRQFRHGPELAAWIASVELRLEEFDRRTRHLILIGASGDAELFRQALANSAALAEPDALSRLERLEALIQLTREESNAEERLEADRQSEPAEPLAEHPHGGGVGL